MIEWQSEEQLWLLAFPCSKLLGLQQDEIYFIYFLWNTFRFLWPVEIRLLFRKPSKTSQQTKTPILNNELGGIPGTVSLWAIDYSIMPDGVWNLQTCKSPARRTKAEQPAGEWQRNPKVRMQIQGTVRS